MHGWMAASAKLGQRPSPTSTKRNQLMGYPVYYDGEIAITPPLSEEHAATLMAVVNHE